MPDFDIAGLLERNSEDRKLRAYAYLTASFHQTPNTSDIVDCLIPFIADGVTRQAGRLLDLGELSAHLQTIGLQVPLYALRQLIPHMERLGLVEWNHAAKRHLCKKPVSSGLESIEISKGLEASFDAFEGKFHAFAQRNKFERPPASPSWSDALIAFFRSETAAAALKSTTIGDTLVLDTNGVETFLVARFVQETQKNDPGTFEIIVRIYTGVLIEDFINNIQSIGDTSNYRQLAVYYDTTVVLRLLGTSGTLLFTATVEMHRSLQDLGCRCYYLEYTADEISRILDTLVTNHELGSEIFGETSEAIINGEITMGRIRDIRATFEQRLGELNIFPVSYNVANRKAEEIFHISEDALVTAIEAEAAKRRRVYKRTSALSDARSVAIIMRLRKGLSRRSISTCGHLFISHNPILQTAARNYVVKDIEGYESGQIPPVITLGQITTAAWLATAKTLEPVNVTKELLATCYNAVRPSPAWTREFSVALDEFRRNKPQAIEERANAALFLQIARNNARDESYNQPAVLHRANIAELFEAAAAEADQKEREREAQIAALEGEHRSRMEHTAREAAERQAQTVREAEEQIRLTARLAEEQAREAELRHETEKATAIEETAREAAAKSAADLREATGQHRRKVARNCARYATLVFRVIISAALGYLLFLLSTGHWEIGSVGDIIGSATIALLLVLGNLDLLGIKVVQSAVHAFQSWLEGRLYNLLMKLDPASDEHLSRIEPHL